MVMFFKRLWCRIVGHNEWVQVIFGEGFNHRTGQIVRHHDEFIVCLRCKAKRPR